MEFQQNLNTYSCTQKEKKFLISNFMLRSHSSAFVALHKVYISVHCKEMQVPKMLNKLENWHLSWLHPDGQPFLKNLISKANCNYSLKYFKLLVL